MRSGIHNENALHYQRKRRANGESLIDQQYIDIETASKRKIEQNNNEIISETNNVEDHAINSATKCAKMTEENGIIKNGKINGNADISSNAVNQISQSSPSLVNQASSMPSAVTENVTLTTSTIVTATAIAIINTLSPSSSSSTVTTSAENSPTTKTKSKSLSAGNSTQSTKSVATNDDSSSPKSNGHSNDTSASITMTGTNSTVDTSMMHTQAATSSIPNKLKASNNNGIAPIAAATASNIFGGRLQFFKDGKFILELARSKEDRGGWISVPRKTYWPPAAKSNNNSATHNKNESSTSLSFSDDNSSIQSSPWQREHCWKQASPRRNLSKEMCMYFWRPSSIVLSAKSTQISRLKRRRLHHPNASTQQRVEYVKRGSPSARRRRTFDTSDCTKMEVDESSSPDVVDGSASNSNSSERKETTAAATTATGKESQSETVESTKLTHSVAPLPRRKQLTRSKLGKVLEKLIEKVSNQPQNVVTTQIGPGAGTILSSTAIRSSDLGQFQQHVSPRKRILREFEKVSLEESTSNPALMKRSRSKSDARSTNGFSQKTDSQSVQTSNGNINGTTATTSTSRALGSYSITSLLGHNNSNSCNSSPRQETSPKSPTSRLIATSKKRSPTNGSIGSPLSGSNSLSSFSHRSPMNSPVNYGRNARSPDVNSPSPDHHSIRNHAYRTFGGSASISSPTSGFHPYMPSSRGSPHSSGSMSPTTLDRFRSNYRTAVSPSSVTSGSSVSGGQSLSYSSTNGSPTTRYSPSNSQTSPPYQKSSIYSINNLVSESNNGNGSGSSGSNVCRNISISQNYSPNTKPTEPSSPASNAKSNSNNNSPTVTRTVPKKTASIRQQFESLSSPIFSNSETTIKSESQSRAEFEHSQFVASTTTSSLHTPTPNHFYPYALPPQSIAAVAAYFNPMYYPMPSAYGSTFRPPFWMPQYPSASSQSPNARTPVCPPLISYAANDEFARASAATATHPLSIASLSSSASPKASAFKRHTTNSNSDFEPFPVAVKDEPSSDVPLNLSKH